MSGTPKVSVPAPVRAAAKVSDAVASVAKKKNPPKPAPKKDDGSDERARIMAKARSGKPLTPAERGKLTSGQVQKLISEGNLERTPTNAGGGWVPVPGDTSGGTDFGSVPNTPGAISADGNNIVPVGTPGSTRPDEAPATSGGKTTPPPPDLNAIPEDEQYRLDRAARQRALNSSLAGYGANEDALASDYGLSFGRYAADQTDAQGNKIAYAGDVNFGSIALPDASRYDADRGFDTANPFSRASRLNQAFTTNRKVSTGSYANRGLLTSGAYGRQQYRDADRYQGGIRALQGEFAQKLGDYRNQRTQARSDFDTSNIEDRRQLIQRALQQYQLNNPSA